MSDSLSRPYIYLDHAATTPLDPAVLDLMLPHLRETYGNPSSFHQVGRRAADVLAGTRAEVAEVLGVSANEIVFTGSGTESDNLAILGLARAHKQNGNHVVVSAIEHKAVLAAAETLENEGFVVTRVLPDHDGVVSAAAIQAALTSQTVLVSVMLANNEIGTIQPIAEIGNVVRQARTGFTPLLHTDACQAPGLISVSPQELGVDAMSLNGSKVYGPKGVGVLYLRSGVSLRPVVVGGEQESNRRAGTESVALVVGCARALKNAVAHASEESQRILPLQQYFIGELRQRFPDVVLNGRESNRLPNNVHVCFPNIEGESLVLLLDQAGIGVATGSACSARDLSPSHVLKAIGRSDDIIHGSIRFSFGRDTTRDDLVYTLNQLELAVARLRLITASTTKAISKNHYAK